MKSAIFSGRSVRHAMEAASPGHIDRDSIKFFQEHLEEYVKATALYARQLAFFAGRKRISKEDLKMAIAKK